MKRVLTVLCTLAVAAAFTGSPVLAHDEPTEGMPGKLLLVKGGSWPSSFRSRLPATRSTCLRSRTIRP
jgi:hypothetical protein